MIKTVFIDLDDTLWATQENNKAALNELYTLHDWSKGYESFEALFQHYYPHNEYLWGEYREGRISKHELTIRRFSYFLDAIGEYSEEEILALNEEFLERTAVKTGVIDGVFELLKHLKALYQIVIVSNGFVEVQHQKMDSAGITPYIDYVVLSEDVGVSKPAKGIFDYALSISKTRRNEVIFIGDSWEADIEGAQNASIPSIWFNPNHKSAPQPLDQYRYPILEVHSLQEIIPLLRSIMTQAYFV